MRDMACELSLTHQRGDTLVSDNVLWYVLNDGSVGPSTPARCAKAGTVLLALD